MKLQVRRAASCPKRLHIDLAANRCRRGGMPGSSFGILRAGCTASENDRAGLQALFTQRGWQLFDENWLRDQLHKMAKRGYENEVSAVVAKLLLRETK